MSSADSKGKKRRHEEAGNQDRKKKFKSDGTPSWAKSHIEGPGIWASCIRGKERATVGELYDLFGSLASGMWPEEENEHDAASDEEQNGKSLSLEEQIANEVSAIKRPKKEARFVNCPTNTQCVIFMSCKPPVDPVELVIQHVKNVKETGITHTRYLHRLVPVSGTCATNPPQIQALCRNVFEPFFAKHADRKFTYKIELRTRNHTTLDRMTLIQMVAQCIPEGHTVSLTEPEIFILVEVFKSTFGVSVVKDYYSLAKFNVMELASAQKSVEGEHESRVHDVQQTNKRDNKENS